MGGASAFQSRKQAVRLPGGTPPNVKSPAPVGIHFHEYGGNLNRGYGWWYNAERGAILLSTNQIPFDWWTGYHERIGTDSLETPDQWRSGVVRPYTQLRVLGFLTWLATTRRDGAAHSVIGSAGVQLDLTTREVLCNGERARR